MNVSSLLQACMALMRRPMVWVWLTAGLAVGGLFLVCSLLILDGKREADRESDQAAANIIDTIEHDTARTSEIYDLSLQGIIRGLSEPETARLTGIARQFTLFDYSANATYLNAMLVLDETGKIVDDSREVPPPDLNLMDRDYFQVHRDNPDVGMYVSRPFQSRFQQGEWAMAISRRISKPDGSFGGVAVGILDLNYFQSLFANLSLGSGGEITIFRDDGTLVARKPFRLTAIGRNINLAPLFQQYPTARAGHFEFTPVSDGISRRFTFKRIANLPLVVSVGFSVADIYAPWRQKAIFAGALMMGLGLIICDIDRFCFRANLRGEGSPIRGCATLSRPFRPASSSSMRRIASCSGTNDYVEGRVNRRIEVGMRYEDSLRESLSRGVIRRCGRARRRMAEGATRSP